MNPEQLEAFENLALRQARVERRLIALEKSLPQLISSFIGMFFKAAADARVKPQAFEFALFDPATDDINHTLRLVQTPEGLEIFAFQAPDTWVKAQWVMPDSVIWNMAQQYLLNNNLTDAHVKLTADVPVTEEPTHE